MKRGVLEAGGGIFIKGVFCTSLQAPVHVPLCDGGFSVAWQSYSRDLEGHVIWVQCLDRRGAARGRPFIVNHEVTESELWVALAPLEDGGFVVYWQPRDNPGSLGWGQRFDDSGQRRGVVSDFNFDSTVRAMLDDFGGYPRSAPDRRA